MKVLALNGSPRLEKSSTYHMLTPLLEGMEAAGAETRVIHIHRLNLKPCLGCYSCWIKTPGVCVHDDGMAEALLEYNRADFLIFATPLYFSLMSGEMKIFIDRLLPLSEPSLVARKDDASTTAHPERFGEKRRQMLLLSPCGFPEYQNFDALVYSFRFLAGKNNWNYIGEILRSGAELLSQDEFQGCFNQYYDLLRKTGERLVREGYIPAHLQQELRKDLLPGDKENFYAMADVYWEQKMSKNETKGRTTKRKETDEMNTEKNPQEAVIPLYDLLAKMPQKFNAHAAADFQGDIQLNFSGLEAGQYYFNIKHGGCTFHEGLSADPDLTMCVASEDWKAIAMGELSGQEAFMSGRLKAEGDFRLMMKWQSFFQAA